MLEGITVPSAEVHDQWTENLEANKGTHLLKVFHTQNLWILPFLCTETNVYIWTPIHLFYFLCILCLERQNKGVYLLNEFLFLLGMHGFQTVHNYAAASVLTAYFSIPVTWIKDLQVCEDDLNYFIPQCHSKVILYVFFPKAWKSTMTNWVLHNHDLLPLDKPCMQIRLILVLLQNIVNYHSCQKASQVIT